MLSSHNVRRAPPLAAALWLLTVLPACGGDGDTSSQAVASSSGAQAGPTTTGTGAGGAGTGGVGPGGAGGGGGKGGAPPCALGASWSLVDDFVFSPGEPSNPESIAAGPGGVMYASGVVRK